MKRKHPWSALGFLLLAAVACASEPEEAQLLDAAASRRTRVVPHISAWMLGGQDQSAGQGKSLGLATLNAAASAQLSEGWNVLPSYQGFYQTTRQTLDVGERTVLVQSRMDHKMAAKLIWGSAESAQRLKFSVGARHQYLSETKDEAWGKGLFDYRKYSAGLEWEYVFRKPYDSFRLGYDYYKVTYPNYVTLESRGLLQINGQPVARELIGGRVLDSNVHAMLLGVSGRFADAVPWDLFYVGALQSFPQQNVVDESDQLTAATRRDVSHDVNASVRGSRTLDAGELKRVRGGLRAAYAWTRSNQSSFNAADGRYFARYYDFSEWRVGPSVAAYVSNPSPRRDPMQISASWDVTRRYYPNRLVQDANGAYGERGIYTTAQSLSVNLNWPLSKFISIIASYRSIINSSNMKDERFSSYNYYGRTYLVGFGYEL